MRVNGLEMARLAKPTTQIYQPNTSSATILEVDQETPLGQREYDDGRATNPNAVASGSRAAAERPETWLALFQGAIDGGCAVSDDALSVATKPLEVDLIQIAQLDVKPLAERPE